MPTSIVLGANGQDGSYLCEALLAAGERVIGVGRQAAYARPLPAGTFDYVQVDLCNLDALRSVLSAERPDNIYHVAAVHGEAGFLYEPVVAELFSVSVLSLHVCLEYLRQLRGGRLYYASSAKVFGASPEGAICEQSLKKADCIYSAAKMAAGHLIDCYRRDHALQAIVAVMFNHESPRRGPGYFVPKIAAALGHALRDDGVVTDVNSLDFFADWGSAREYMDMSVRAMQLGLSGDYILATGKTVWAAAAVEALFASHGLQYSQWLNASVVGSRPAQATFVANPEKLHTALGYGPQLGFSQLVEEMVGSTGSSGGSARD